MANDIASNLHVIDTDGAGLIVSASIYLAGVRWVSPLSAAGDQAIITDAAGRVLWESVANAADYVERDVIRKYASGGYKVPTLDSGKLYIEVTLQWPYQG